MLDRAKLLKEMNHHASAIIYDTADELTTAINVWRSIEGSEEFAARVRARSYQLKLPTWQESLGGFHQIQSGFKAYTVISVDGSQVYPDRHQGHSCFLINIGSIVLTYNPSGSRIIWASEPAVFKARLEEREEASLDQVDCKRSEHELLESLKLSKKYSEESECQPVVCLVDGSLIFWHLESKPSELKSRYFVSYLTVLQQFYEHKIPVAGYISLPKSKELINLIRFAQEEDAPACMKEKPEEFQVGMNVETQKKLTYLVDADVMGEILPEGARSIFFEHHSPIVDQYPAALKPYFFYINTGYEIARVEIPSWLRHEPSLIEILTRTIMDQVEKGRGYPVVLAEAHEAAVVTSGDREFFYRLLEQQTIQQNKRYIISQKSLKKRNKSV